MTIERSNLDGLLVQDGPGLALVFHGVKHAIDGKNVQIALFGDKELEPAVTRDLAEGALLGDGTCLAKAQGLPGYFLVTGLPATKRHLILNYESFLEFGFDEQQVREVPWLVLQAVPLGREISTAKARIS